MKLTPDRSHADPHHHERHKHPLFERLERVEGWIDIGALLLIAALAVAFIFALMAPAGDAPWMG